MNDYNKSTDSNWNGVCPHANLPLHDCRKQKCLTGSGNGQFENVEAFGEWLQSQLEELEEMYFEFETNASRVRFFSRG